MPSLGKSIPRTASQQIASTKPVRAFDRIPVELWVKIAQALPAHSLFSFVLTSRKIYISANPLLYRTVQFVGSDIRYPRRLKPRSNALDSCFGVHRAQSWLSDPDCSSPINHMSAFLKTITTNSTLHSHVESASFRWDNTAPTEDIRTVKRCLEHMKQSIYHLHIGLPNFYPGVCYHDQYYLS